MCWCHKTSLQCLDHLLCALSGCSTLAVKECCLLSILTPFLEKAMAAHCSTLAWQIPWMEEPGRLQSMGSLGVRHDWATSLSLFTFMHWRRKWQYTPVFLVENPRDRGAWWAAVYGVARSRTRLKRLSSSSSSGFTISETSVLSQKPGVLMKWIFEISKLKSTSQKSRNSTNFYLKWPKQKLLAGSKHFL